MKFIVSEAHGYDAEQISAENVIGYLSDHYPYIIKNSKEFYIRKAENTCISGIKINTEIQISDKSNIENLYTGDGLYAVLHGNFTGDYSHYKEILLSWLRDNRLSYDKDDIFAIYDAKTSYDNPKIKIYCVIKSIPKTINLVNCNLKNEIN
jgi:hypothetical protein